MKEMKLLFSVTKKDLIRQTFRAGGKGGQNQNKVESAVRFIHEQSGARGEARDSRDQKTNERNAFVRLVQSPKFQTWHKAEVARRLMADAVPARDPAPFVESMRDVMKRVDKTIEEGLKNGDIAVETYEP